jgi:hypothetical protein
LIPNFTSEYRSLFKQLSFPLQARDGDSIRTIAAQEIRLGVKIPLAIRAYYEVAGRHRKLNQVFQRLRSPHEWEVESGKLIFMDENQGVVAWAVSATTRQTIDPPTFQGPVISDAIPDWYLEHRKTSQFLKFNLHLQAAYGGGMPYTSSIVLPRAFQPPKGFRFIAEIGGMRAYSSGNRVLCVIQCASVGNAFQQSEIFLGAHSKIALKALEESLNREAQATAR